MTAPPGASVPNYEKEWEEHGKLVKDWRAAFLSYRRGERSFPGPHPHLPDYLDAWRRKQTAAEHAANGGTNVVNFDPIAAIQHETGVDRESAQLLSVYRGGGGSLYLTDAQTRFCEALEQKLANEKVERVLGRGPGYAPKNDAGADTVSSRDTTAAQPAPARDEPLSYVDLALDLTPRQWHVLERIPMRNVSMLGGEGSIGKSLLLMQLSGATVLGKDWIGTLPEQGSVLYVSCEEDDEEVRRRMDDVARHLHSTRQEMIETGLRFISLAGKDAVLAQPDRAGIMRPTPLFERIRRDAMEQRPKLIVFDTVADVFAGKENDRSQARQFVTLLRGLAIETESAVVIAAHPSLTGIATDTGLSGTTGWHNSVRARIYFKPAPGDDPALRVLETRKSNYSAPGESILLRWRDGVYVVEPGKGTLERLAIEAEIDQLFLKLLRRFTEQGRNVSDKKSPTYAPKLFAEQPEATERKITSRMFAEAMERLFAANKLRVVTLGSASRMRSRIVEREASN
jgi:RecA-family ATPase